MTDMIPASMMPILHTVAGILLMALGLSYGYKFFIASLMGKVNYWAGLEAFGVWNLFSWIFIPMTILVTPLFVHTAPKETNLIKSRTAGWVHLFWGPVFFMLSLLFLVSGADFLGLPGTQFMNLVLTGGRPDVPPAITYQPPFTYKFPILKRARKTVFKILTADIKRDKSKSLNAFEKRGDDVSSYGGKLEDDEE
ncbi:MAG: hypothetical protein K2X27_18720 [Candidatus Obscuribacterales bacterium]|nr:hypothetical protein [Candidatus Obscuribacterales bacterium]